MARADEGGNDVFDRDCPRSPLSEVHLQASATAGVAQQPASETSRGQAGILVGRYFTLSALSHPEELARARRAIKSEGGKVSSWAAPRATQDVGTVRAPLGVSPGPHENAPAGQSPP